MHATIASQPTQARQMDYCLADFFLTNLALEGTLMWGNVRDAQDLLTHRRSWPHAHSAESAVTTRR